MKLFQRSPPAKDGGGPSHRRGESGTFALSVQSSVGDDDMALLLSPSPSREDDPDDEGSRFDDSTLRTNSTAASQSSTRRRLRRPPSQLKLFRKTSRQDSIAEARGRAAARLEPPPFTASRASRLNELKAAKFRAEERIEEREERSRSGESDNYSVISLASAATTRADEEHMVNIQKGGAVFLASILLHIVLVPLRNNAYAALFLVALQSVSLWALLRSALVYAFDHIDFGQMMLVKNMDLGKKLFVDEVGKYSMVLAVVVSAASFVVALGGKAMINFVKLACGLWEGQKMCAYGGAAVAPWAIKALEYSTFATSRLGVFVLALLLMSHLLLPRRKKRSRAKRPGTVQRASTVDIPRKARKGGALKCSVSFVLATATIAAAVDPSPLSSNTQSQRAIQSILVAGSLNADTFLPISRFPSPGENLTLLPNCQPLVDVPGGKGCNQAIACARLSKETTNSNFLGQFGNDAAAEILRNALVENNVDISSCGYSKLHPSGRGYVMIVPGSGEVSAVVSGGSNQYGWGRWGVRTDDGESVDEEVLTDEDIEGLLASHSLLLLQCEVPHLVNLRLAQAAQKMNVPVIVDVGGEDRKMERELLKCCDFLVPNETELDRLAQSYDDDGEVDGYHGMMLQELHEIQAQIGASLHLTSIIKSAQTLQNNGASNVLVTLGSSGSILVRKRTPALKGKPLLYQPPCHLPAGSSVVDETGAGDCYRAAFAVALLENCGGTINSGDVDDGVLLQCMKFASAAGAYAVTTQGAVPSIPSRVEVEELLAEADSLKNAAATNVVEAIPRGGSPGAGDKEFPFLFGSRINSMKDRLDLVDPSALPLATPRDYLLRQAKIRGLGCVDFNFPQHFEGYWTPEEAKKALDEVNLVAGAVCLRYPNRFARGAMNHPDLAMRREAIEITKQAAEAARILGCNEVVVWSAYDGYDYPFQVSYQEKWREIVEAFQECCDAYPDIKWSLEFKPTDENTRFFTVPSTGAAVLLVKEIDRPNMGLTLDMGHMLMSGENPGQSIAMVGEKLFGIQLNDGYTRLAAEDGMMFGSIHPSIALEAMYQLRRINFSGHLYFDTFPQRTDPVKEAEYNIRRVKEFWAAVEKMDGNEVDRIAKEHDAIGALELVNEALRR